MILTNVPVRRSRKSVWHVVVSYIARWRIEDVIRFVKRSCRRASKRVFGIPDFRLYALADGIRQFLYSQAQGLKKLLELQSMAPVEPSL